MITDLSSETTQAQRQCAINLVVYTQENYLSKIKVKLRYFSDSRNIIIHHQHIRFARNIKGNSLDWRKMAPDENPDLHKWMKSSRNGKRLGKHMGTPHFIALHWYCVLYKLKLCGNPAPSQPNGAIFPIAFVHFVSLCHILVILRYFKILNYGDICYGDPCSVIMTH